MSAYINPAEGSASYDPIAEAGSSPRAAATATFSLNKGFASMEELEKAAPALGKAIKQALFEQFQSQMQKHEARMKEIRQST